MLSIKGHFMDSHWAVEGTPHGQNFRYHLCPLKQSQDKCEPDFEMNSWRLPIRREENLKDWTDKSDHKIVNESIRIDVAMCWTTLALTGRMVSWMTDGGFIWKNILGFQPEGGSFSTGLGPTKKVKKIHNSTHGYLHVPRDPYKTPDKCLRRIFQERLTYLLLIFADGTNFTKLNNKFMNT